MANRRSHRRHARKKEPIQYNPADLSNVVICLGEIKNIMNMLIAEIDRIEHTPLKSSDQLEFISKDDQSIFTP